MGFLSGFDASAHMAEETRNAGKAAPKGVIMYVTNLLRLVTNVFRVSSRPLILSDSLSATTSTRAGLSASAPSSDSSTLYHCSRAFKTSKTRSPRQPGSRCSRFSSTSSAAKEERQL